MHDHLTASALTNMGAGISTTFFAMTDTVNLAIVAGAANVVIGIATLYFAYKAKAISTEAKEAVNGKMEEFKKMAEEIFHAKGVADEKVSAESKAGIEAIGAAKGRAEAISAPVVLQAAASAPVAASSPASPTRMGEAITELKAAAEETSVAADKTVDIVEKQHGK